VKSSDVMSIICSSLLLIIMFNKIYYLYYNCNALSKTRGVTKPHVDIHACVLLCAYIYIYIYTLYTKAKDNVMFYKTPKGL
jgi:hypothetical protein